VNAGVEELLGIDLGTYYRRRIQLHMQDSYAGVRMRKFPEDLAALEHLLWEQRVDAVVEIGTGHGGSALWFRDRLRTLAAYGRAGGYLVVSVDRDLGPARFHLARVDPSYERSIKLVEADVRDPSVVARVRAHLPPGARVLVVEDSAHRYDTTLAALRGFSSLVPPLGYLVVEDGHRDIPGMLPDDMPGRTGGVLRAIDEWLAGEAHGRFTVRREQERYVVTSNPRGWLQRIDGSTTDTPEQDRTTT